MNRRTFFKALGALAALPVFNLFNAEQVPQAQVDADNLKKYVRDFVTRDLDHDLFAAMGSSPTKELYANKPVVFDNKNYGVIKVSSIRPMRPFTVDGGIDGDTPCTLDQLLS